LLENLKTDLAVLELEPAGGGCFEVSVDGEEIYSKLATGEFPEERAILEAVRSRVL
jgi:selenoprotein W-related protein